MSRPPRIGGRPVVELALEIRQVLLGQRHRVRLVARDQANYPVAPLYVDGPDVLRPVLAESAAFDHGRTAHADVGVGGCDDHVACAGQGGIAGEATPGDDRHQRHLATQCAQCAEGRHIQTGDIGEVGVTGSATAAFGEQHHRQLSAGGQVEDPIGFGMVAHALCAGQHGVVVGQHDCLGSADCR